MQFLFALMEEADARAILAWRYEGQYTIYNWEEEDDPVEMLDRRFLALFILFVTSHISTAFHEYYS